MLTVRLAETQTLELLHLSKSQIPLIFVGGTMQRGRWRSSLQEAPTIALKWGRMVIFTVAVYWALDEKALREERDRPKSA